MSHTLKRDGWAMIFNSDMSGLTEFVAIDGARFVVPGELITDYIEKYVRPEEPEDHSALMRRLHRSTGHGADLKVEMRCILPAPGQWRFRVSVQLGYRNDETWLSASGDTLGRALLNLISVVAIHLDDRALEARKRYDDACAPKADDE